MEKKLYEAAVEGDIEQFQEITEQLNLIVTPNKNTILHVNIAFNDRMSNSFVERVLEICPLLLLQVNDNDDTPLHVAAKQGRVAIVEVLIKQARTRHDQNLESGVTAVKQMLRMTNKEGNTALHEAAKNHSVRAVAILTGEDPEFSYSANDCGETPLYMAASTGSLGAVVEILQTCRSATDKGPCGMTALHVAVKRNRPEITKKLLENRRVTNETDQNGWTPLHYAAYYGFRSIVQLLVEVDASAAYIADNDRKMTALHLAAGQGRFDIIKTITSSCPDCVELVDDRGWNYVHFAMVSLSPTELKIFVGGCATKYLMKAKDLRGTTPLILRTSIRGPASYDIKKMVQSEHCERAVQLQDQLKKEISELSEVRDGPYQLGVVRKHYSYSYEISIESWKSKTENREIRLIVTALIATVTFAAGFTFPGGYIQEGSNQGTAFLIRNSAFQAFVVSDTIAFVLAVSAMFCHFFLQILGFEHYYFLFNYADTCTLRAMESMVVAFVTGVYAMLRPSSGLAITTAIIGLSFFVIELCVYLKICSIKRRELLLGPEFVQVDMRRV